MKHLLALIFVLMFALPCSAEEWNGYKIGDVYYDEYTKKPEGIVTKFVFLNGKVDGIEYSEELYKAKVEETESIKNLKHWNWKRGYEQGYQDGYKDGRKSLSN